MTPAQSKIQNPESKIRDALSLPVIVEWERDRIARELAGLIEGEVRFGRHERMLYATDASIYQVEPIGIVCPRTIDEAVRVIEWCWQRGLPVLPRGGGTSLAGQAVNRAVILDFSVHCRSVLDIDPARRVARVEPGVVLDDLNAAAAVHGLMFGPDVATSAHANIGGMIGNNSSGAHSIRYGRTVEHLIGLDVVLADGSRLRFEENSTLHDARVAQMTERVAAIVRSIEDDIDARFPRTLRRVNGYNLDLILQQLRASTRGTFDRVNLAHLVCGSEGTLAVTLGATVKLVPMPAAVGLAIVAFASVAEALAALPEILATRPAAVELIDDVVIQRARANREYCRYVDLLPAPPAGETGAVLYVEYFAGDAAERDARLSALASSFSDRCVSRYVTVTEMAQAWKLRRAGEPLLHSLPGGRKPLTFIEDLAVDPANLGAFVEDFRALAARHGTTAAYYAHASVGCLHIRPLLDPHNSADRASMEKIAEEATELVMRYGGALSGEHGDGRARSHLLEQFYGPRICDAFRAIKQVFDPQNRLNPGNIVAPLRLTEHLRVRPERDPVAIPAVKTFFRYEREHGFGEAVEMCNGAGVCRKMRGGTMCPSYRATRDERHATRGRGNALRLAITGQVSENGRAPRWNDPETLKTLELCLSCKACKSECPSNVDIAKLKAEYVAHSYAAAGGAPFVARAFGRIRTINRIGSALHPLANAVAGRGPARALIDRVLKLHPKRCVPTFARSLLAWQRSRRRATIANDAPCVILFSDCFTTYNEPRIGQAATLVLERLGYRVLTPDNGCCGRGFLSTSMLGDAAATIRRTAQRLLRDLLANEGIEAVVFCEPSCLSAIKDEWLELELGRGAPDLGGLRELAAKAFLVEDFIDARWDMHPNKLLITAPAASSAILLHGHCHQKALWGVETSSRLLHRLFGDRVNVLDSGCCGMAGQFGYTRDHYEISMRIGELSLFPSLRAAPETIIAAPGTSCRQQIRDALGRTAVHPVELVAQALDPSAASRAQLRC